MKRMNKSGQQMTLGTIIAIVLGIAVLVFLIFGFSSGWNNLWSKINAFGGGDVNVDTVTQACALACSGGNYGYCEQQRTVNYGDGYWEKGSCDDLERGRIAIPPCAVNCGSNADSLVTSDSCEGMEGKWVEGEACAKGEDVLEVGNGGDLAGHIGSVCCK